MAVTAKEKAGGSKSPFGPEVPNAEDSVSRRVGPLYAPFFGLNEAPFDLTPNPRFLFLTRQQAEALGNLRYALTSSRGFTLIIGDAGTGKTTLVRAALDRIGDTTSRYVVVNNPTLARAEFYDHLAQGFGLSEGARHSKTQFLKELQAQVEDRFAKGGITGLVIDEAQSLPHELLEEVRLLGNIETATAKLLNVVLCGQPELADRLNDPSLRQFKQRLALRCELRPLHLSDTASYISGRLRIAGGSPKDIFTRDAVVAIHEASAGIPRLINVIADNALIGGFAAQVKPVPVEIVDDVCRDFDVMPSLGADSGQPAASPRLALPGAVPEAPPSQQRQTSAGLARLRSRFRFFS